MEGGTFSRTRLAAVGHGGGDGGDGGDGGVSTTS